MQPAKRRNSDNYTLCGPPAKTVPEPPVSTEDSKKSSLLKAFEAVVAAGRRGLLGPAARAAVEAMPDLDLECRDGKAGQETPSSVPLVEEKKEETKEKEEEKTPEEEEEEGKNKGEKGKECNTVVTVTPSLKGTGTCQPTKKEIWIIGDSEISVASQRAKFSKLGSRLGIPSSASVVWRGVRTIHWNDLLPYLHQLYHQRPNPSIIILHLGESDLLLESSCSLATKMQNDLGVLQRAFPDVVLIWSSLLTKPVWTPTEESQVMESKRNDVNCKMEEYCDANGICYLSHPLFTAENKVLFFPNNTMTNAGADIFVVDLKKVLHTYLNHTKC